MSAQEGLIGEMEEFQGKVFESFYGNCVPHPLDLYHHAGCLKKCIQFKTEIRVPDNFNIIAANF